MTNFVFFISNNLKILVKNCVVVDMSTVSETYKRLKDREIRVLKKSQRAKSA